MTMEAARRALAARVTDGITVRRRSPSEKAAERPRSLRLAVTAKCWDCVGAGADPNPRRAIRECPCAKCALYRVRPYQQASRDEA